MKKHLSIFIVGFLIISCHKKESKMMFSRFKSLYETISPRAIQKKCYTQSFCHFLPYKNFQFFHQEKKSHEGSNNYYKNKYISYLGLASLSIYSNMKRVIAEDDHEYVCGFDIETSGCHFNQNGLLSIGCSIQDESCNELEYFQINIDLPKDRKYEKDCLENFWLKHPEAFKFVQSNTYSPEEAMKKFHNFISSAEKKYPKLLLVSDNPTFDLAWINIYLCVYTDRKPLNYSEKGKYRQLWDSSTLQKHFYPIMNYSSIPEKNRKFLRPVRKHRQKLGLKIPEEHDHTALNDARIVAENYIMAKKKMIKYCKSNEQKDEQIKKLIEKNNLVEILKVLKYLNKDDRIIAYTKDFEHTIEIIEDLKSTIWKK